MENTTSTVEERNSVQAWAQASGSYSSNLHQSNVDISQSHSINTSSIHPEYVISEEIFAGQRVNGKMSNVRRFFCLFVTFDLLFTTLMWLICIMFGGDDIATALKKEIVHYDVHCSLFDIVMVAVFRFLVLLLVYAILYFNHWIVISLSTTITCGLLIAKVFVFKWQNSSQPVFQVLLILVSFVLSWGEVWFLDYRVIPQETHAKQFLLSSPETERTPLIRSYVQGLPSMYTESVGNFYSPMGTPEGSLNRFDIQTEQNRFPPFRFTRDQESYFRKLGSNILQESWKLLNSDEWVLQKQKKGEFDSVYTMSLHKIGKIYKLVMVVDVPAKLLLDELFYKVETIPSWNPTLLESCKIQTFDENLDITYQVSAEGAGGLVSSRDFVSLRRWGEIDGCYVIAVVSVEHPSVPVQNKHIRGENGVSCWTMRPIPDMTERCTFEWMMNTNLKGWISKKVLDTALTGVMFTYAENLRKHLQKIGTLIVAQLNDNVRIRHMPKQQLVEASSKFVEATLLFTNLT